MQQLSFQQQNTGIFAYPPPEYILKTSLEYLQHKITKTLNFTVFTYSTETYSILLFWGIYENTQVAITYTDAAIAGIDENSLYLAVWDESVADWVDATATCSPAGTIIHDPDNNLIIVTTCATGEFALLGTMDDGVHQIYLPLIMGFVD